MTLLEFEQKLGKSVDKMTIDDVKQLVEDSEFLLALNTEKDFVSELVDKILETNTDESVKAEFIPIKYHNEVYDSQIKLSQMFAQFADDKDTEKLVRELKEFMKGATPLSKMNAYLVILNAFEDYDLSQQAEEVEKTMKEVEDTLYTKIDPQTAFPLACEIIDAVYNIQQLYFEKYGIDVIREDAEKLNDYVEKLNAVAKPMYDAMMEELDDYVPEDATPEDLGLLDVTKLNEKEEDN